MWKGHISMKALIDNRLVKCIILTEPDIVNKIQNSNHENESIDISNNYGNRAYNEIVNLI